MQRMCHKRPCLCQIGGKLNHKCLNRCALESWWERFGVLRLFHSIIIFFFKMSRKFFSASLHHAGHSWECYKNWWARNNPQHRQPAHKWQRNETQPQRPLIIPWYHWALRVPLRCKKVFFPPSGDLYPERGKQERQPATFLPLEKIF